MNREVLEILERKTRCLRKFKDLTISFLKSATAGDWSRLESLERERSAILKICEQYDHKITRAIESMPAADKTESFLTAVGRAIEEKDLLIREIQRIDTLFMAEIENEQERLMTEGLQNRKSRQMIGKFKSQSERPLGEGLDKTL